MHSTLRRTTIIAAAAALAVGIGSLVAVGCEGDDSAVVPRSSVATATEDETSVSGAPTLTVAAAPLRVKLGRLAGNLPPSKRRPVVKRIGSVVDAWFAGAFVDGDYPREDFARGFAGFTAGAARQAQRQEAVTTNAALGSDLVEVVPTRRLVRLSVFAPHRRAAGATADVSLVLVGLRQDQSQVEVAVTGQLFLTKDSGWRVFGFDVRRSVGAVGAYARSKQDRR